MRKSLGIVAILTFGLSLVACGGDDDLSLDDLGPSFIDAACERAVRCGAYTSKADCVANAEFDVAEIEAAVEAGRVDFHGDKAADCIDALRDASCDRSLEENRTANDDCDGTFEGTVADGGTCFNSDECISDNCVAPETCTMACCAGTCGAATTIPGIGQACPDFECADGAFCNEAGTCVALVASGGACTSTADCTYGLYCTEAGTCADAPNRGNACPEGVCADLGDRCDATTTTCVELSGRGGPCAGGFAGIFDCKSPLLCNDTTLVCEDAPAVGAACTFGCASGAFCNANDTCEAEHTDGTACENDFECSSNYCDTFAALPVCAVDPVCGA